VVVIVEILEVKRFLPFLDIIIDNIRIINTDNEVKPGSSIQFSCPVKKLQLKSDGCQAK